MKVLFRLAAFSCTLVMLSSTQPGLAQDASTYLPDQGHEAIVYMHKFNARDFHRGKELVVEGFSKAMEASGQTRRTYFMENPATYEVLVISFFDKDESVDEWHTYAARLEILDKLEAMRREPLQVERFRLIRPHNAN